MRTALRPGDELSSGSHALRVEAVIGMGSNAIVYRVNYKDALSDQRHVALLKELCPDADGIVRVDGHIFVPEEAREAYEHHRRSFLMGNEAHLRQLRAQAGRVTGNIESFDAGGTLYTLLEYQSERTLKSVLASEQPASAERCARRALSVLEALAPFHEEGLLHLDVSPDNILLMPVLHGYEAELEPMLLTDYNGVWDVQSGGEVVHHSKPGYTAPEARLCDAESFSYATDLFGVCAVFFRMLTGRMLTEAECCGQFLPSVCREVEASCAALPQTARHQAVAIIRRGLKPLPRHRYQSIPELRAAILELLDRIHMRGVTQASLWEAACKSLPDDAPPAHPVSISIEMGGERRPADGDILTALQGHLLLHGAGGMGKTTFFKALHRKYAQEYRPSEPACYFIPLSRWRGGANFLLSCLTEHLRPTDDLATEEDARAALIRLLRAPLPSGKPRLILLLDGLNEAGARREPLLRELRMLSEFAGVRVVASSRNGADGERLPDGFSRARIEPPNAMEVDRYIAERGLSSVTPPAVRQALDSPLLLRLYADTWEAWRASGKSLAATDPDFTTADRLRKCFLEGQIVRFEALHRESEADCLRARYAVEHLLPALAAAMRTRPALTLDEARAVVGRDASRLRMRDFARSYPESIGKSRLMMEGIQNLDEWYDLMVRELLAGRMALLSLRADGEVTLLHESFCEGLAREGRLLNKRFIAPRLKRVLAGSVCVALIFGAAFFSKPLIFPTLTRAEKTAVLDLENAGYSTLLEVGQILNAAAGVRGALVDGGQASTAPLVPLSGAQRASEAVPWRKASLNRSAWQTVLSAPQETSRLTLAALLVLSDAYDGSHSAEYRAQKCAEYDEFAALQERYLLLCYYAAYADSSKDAQELLYQGFGAQPALREAFLETAKPTGDSAAICAQRDTARDLMEETAFYDLAEREAARWADEKAMTEELDLRLNKN